jgi:hypothetical protein
MSVRSERDSRRRFYGASEAPRQATAARAAYDPANNDCGGLVALAITALPWGTEVLRMRAYFLIAESRTRGLEITLGTRS